MLLKEVLSELAKIYNIPSLQFNAYEVSTLTINETLPISFETAIDGQGFFIFTIVGQLSDKIEAKEVLQYLNANLFGNQTGRATLGYDIHTHSLVLFEYFDERELEFTTFLSRFTQFSGYATYWLTKMESSLSKIEV